jgi:hypothetical protein
MSVLFTAYNSGREAALVRFKLAATPAPTNAAAKKAITPPSAPSPTAVPNPVVNVAENWKSNEQPKTMLFPKTRTQTGVKAASEICTTCRKDKHWGPCHKPIKIPDVAKKADFNMGLSGNDPKFVRDSEDGPSTSPGYHAATTADSSLARARDGRPASEQAGTAFALLPTINKLPDQAGSLTGGLHKVALEPGTNLHDPGENRGPSVNPYEMRLTRKGTPIGWGPEGHDAMNHAFDQIDCSVDSANIENVPAAGQSG